MLLLFRRISYGLAARILASTCLLVAWCFQGCVCFGAQVHLHSVPPATWRVLGRPFYLGINDLKSPNLPISNHRSTAACQLPNARRAFPGGSAKRRAGSETKKIGLIGKRARLVVGGFIRFSCPERGSGILRAFALPPSLADSIIKSP